MALCWPLEIPSTRKFVLIALADNANDAGYCWPSISTICERTSLGKTAVIESIRWLEDEGYLVANRENGRKTTYTVAIKACSTDEQTGSPDGPVPGDNQSARRTGAPDEPVRDTDRSAKQTGSPDGPNRFASRTGPVRQADTNRHITVKNQKKKARNAPDPIPPPDGVPAQLWSDYLAIRKAKNAVMTETALAGLRREGEKAGMSLADVLTECCQRNWVGFKLAWLAKDGDQTKAENHMAGAL